MLEVRRLYTGYGGMDVIHGIDFSVGAGEIVALVGANGAGKSTLVKTISGLLPVRSGEILFEGQRIDKLSPSARVLMGIAQVPEGRQVFGGLTVAENLRLGAYVHRHSLSEAEMEGRIREVCEVFPVLRERMGEAVANLSGGQQQMLVIGRGLMAKPRLLVLDEPSLGLAPVIVQAIYAMLPQILESGVTVLLVEQDVSQALRVATHLQCLLEGHTTLEGTPAEVTREQVEAAYFGATDGSNA
jgi:branched-chain amino acid transport system ATP-binding protein